jgi:hypothetical protein
MSDSREAPAAHGSRLRDAQLITGFGTDTAAWTERRR